jgi:hypothetical protein
MRDRDHKGVKRLQWEVLRAGRRKEELLSRLDVMLEMRRKEQTASPLEIMRDLLIN